MPWVQASLAKYPELAVYLTVAVGYVIGKLRVAGIGLGPVTGSLFAGMLIGQFAYVPVSSMAKSLLFLLFLFGIGYSVGPQFMESLKRDGIKPVLVAVVVCLTGLATATSVARFLGLDPGFAAGLLSGALTESPAMGTATEAINALPLPAADRTIMVSHVAVADAVCYMFGAFFVILFCSQIGPSLLRVDLRDEALQLERAYGIERGKAGLFSAWRRFELRAYRVQDGSAVAGSSLAAAESRAAGHRLFVQRIRRGDDIIEAEPSLVLQPGDIVAIAGPRKVLIDLLGEGQQEVEDRDLLDIPVAVVQVLLTNRELAGQRLDELAQSEWTRSVYLRDLTRGGQSVPIAAGIVLKRGDILHMVGPAAVVNRAAARIGSLVAPTAETDFVTLGLAIFIGGLVGILLSVPIGGVRVSLSTSVGTLLAGLAVGHLRTRYPLFGRIPDGAISLMTALGLAAFVAMIGLNAGPVFLASGRHWAIAWRYAGNRNAHVRGPVLWPLRVEDESDLASGGARRRANDDGWNGGRAGPIRKPCRRTRLHASCTVRPHPADDMGDRNRRPCGLMRSQGKSCYGKPCSYQSAEGVPVWLWNALHDLQSLWPVFHRTKSLSNTERRVLAKRVAIAAFGVLVVALFARTASLRLFGISLSALLIGGGLVVAAPGWEMLHEKPDCLCPTGNPCRWSRPLPSSSAP